MARLPTGTIHSVSTAFDTAKNFDGADITNAKPAVITKTSHGLVDNDVIMVDSGWGRLNAKAFRVQRIDDNSFELEASDTTNTTLYFPNGGGGSFRKVTSWQDLDRTLNHTSSGGDPKTVNVKFLESDVEIILNDGFNAVGRTFDMDADMIGTPPYEALKTLSDTDAFTIVRRMAKNGAVSFIPAKVALSGEITATEGEIETFQATINAQNVSTNYPAP